MADEELAVRGIENVCAALSRAPALIVKNCFADALLAGAAPIAQELYVECPVSAKNELFDDETFTVLKGTGTGKMKSKIVADVRIDPAGRGGDLQVGFGNQGFKARMAVDDEVTVGSLLVLADPSFEKRRVFQGREAEADIFSNVF